MASLQEDNHDARLHALVRVLGPAFGLPGRPVRVERLGGGHIHETLLATHDSATGPQRFVYQRLNERVFADLEALVGNATRILAHWSSPLRYLPTVDAKPVFIDDRGAWWRCSPFLEGSRLPNASVSAEVRAVAEAFGAYAAAVATLKPPPRDTIPHFHDLRRRRQALDQAAGRDPAQRAENAAATLAQARRLGAEVQARLDTAGVDRLPRRIAHNDAKLDNVLVHSVTGRPLAITDLDTTMVGPLLNDVGELLRTASHTNAEDETDLQSIAVDPDRVEAIVDGFVRGADGLLTSAERAALPLGGPYLAVENGIRFLTDHLVGDAYYRIHRPGHNLDRARAQLTLTERLLDLV